MALVDDYIVAAGAAVITTTLIILVVLLARYRRLVTESTRSSELAKNVYDSMNNRLSVMDARIIDLMAKVDVYSTRQSVRSAVTPSKSPGVMQPAIETSQSPIPKEVALQVAVAPVSGSNFETERQILGLLVEGPKTSNQINAVVGKSREHMGRLLKGLFQRGLVVRNDRNKPYVYEITEVGRRHLAGN